MEVEDEVGSGYETLRIILLPKHIKRHAHTHSLAAYNLL